jgi:AcrR family transcriptional regulator
MPTDPPPSEELELLDAIADYLVTHGIGRFTYRSLAEALDVSTFKIVYHFGSKPQLIDAALRYISAREIAEVHSWMAQPSDAPPTTGEIMRRYWAWCLQARQQAMMRLFFEAAALQLRDPETYPPVIRDILRAGIALEERIIASNGIHGDHQQALATLVSGALWGLQLDLLSSGDGTRTTAALHQLADLIDRGHFSTAT